MATYDAKRLFDIAKLEYNTCERHICEIIDILATVDCEIKKDTMMTAFDLILQCCLFGGSVEDGKLEDVEKTFITHISAYGNLMQMINAYFRNQGEEWTDIDWEIVSQLKPETLEKLAEISVAITKTYAKSFINILATVDKIVTSKDYMELIGKSAKTIFMCLCGVDGDDLDSAEASFEICSALSFYSVLVEDQWKEVVGDN